MRRLRVRRTSTVAMVIVVATSCSGGSTDNSSGDDSDDAAVASSSTMSEEPPDPTTPPQTPTATDNVDQETPTPVELDWPGVISERPTEVDAIGTNEPVRYLHRRFLQSAAGVAVAPDGDVLIADTLGRHIVRVAEDGSMDDLGIWRDGWFDAAGPELLEFGPDGALYVVAVDHILRVATDGGAERLDGIEGSPVGGIAFAPDGALYYSDRGAGVVRRWNPDGSSTLVADGIPTAKQLSIGPDGTLYVNQELEHQIAELDPATEAVEPYLYGLVLEDRPERPAVSFGDPVAMNIDENGEAWVLGLRSGGVLYRIGDDRRPLPFVIDGTRYGGDPWVPGGVVAGLGIDERGRIWITLFEGGLIRLDPVAGDGAVPDFASTTVVDGFRGTIALGPDGAVSATLTAQQQLVRFDSNGAMTVLAQFDERPWGLAVAPDGTHHVALPHSIVHVAADGTVEPTHRIEASRLGFGLDGALYASISSETVGAQQHIARLGDGELVTTLLTEVDGITLAPEVHIARAPGGRLYLFDELQGNVFLMGLDGTAELVLDLKPIGAFFPAAFAASPTTGDVFVAIEVVPFKNLYRIDLGGNVELMATGVTGDPHSAAVSADGQWLYLKELGAIDVFHIPDRPVRATEPSATPTTTTSTTTTTLPADTLPEGDRMAICDAYVEFTTARSPAHRAEPLAMIRASAGAGAPSGLESAIETLSTADFGSTDVRPSLQLLAAYVLPLCEADYYTGVVGAADDEAAAQQFFDAIIDGDRTAAEAIASDLAMALFEPWDARVRDEQHTWLVVDDGLFYVGLTADLSYACTVGDGIVHSCRP